MDVFCQLRKVDRDGHVLISYNIPLPDLRQMGMEKHDIPNVNHLISLGPSGHLRASQRELDHNLSKPHWPIHSHQRSEKIIAGTIVKLEFGLGSGGMILSPDESIMLKVSGHWMTLAEYPWLRGTHRTINEGKHHLHIGGETASNISLPFVEIED
jgi:predicted acyl esterase